MGSVMKEDRAWAVIGGVLLAAILGLAFWLRWRYIHDISLYVDEFTTLWAATRVQELGIPRMPSGVLYTRGLLNSSFEAIWLGFLGFSYVISPLDFLPSLLFGPLGLLDELVVVAATLSRILNHVHPDVVRSQWPGQGDALDAIQRVTQWSESLFTVRLRGLLRGFLNGR